MRKIFIISAMAMASAIQVSGQEVHQLMDAVKAKLSQVTSYEAEGLMKTNVDFLKVPEAKVIVDYKRPDKLKIRNPQGISLIPRGAMVLSLNGLLQGAFTVIDGGYETFQGNRRRVVKLIPDDENAPWVISTVYIDEKQQLIMKARTTTRDKGTYEVDLSYGKYLRYALPDRILITFSTRDYKLPKGVTFDYDDGSHKEESKTKSEGKGVVEIAYSSYTINGRIPDSVFQ